MPKTNRSCCVKAQEDILELVGRRLAEEFCPDWETRLRATKILIGFFDKREIKKELIRLGWTPQKVAYNLFMGVNHSPRLKERKKALKLRWKVLKRDNFICQYCHRNDVELNVDHIKPISRGGKSSMGNLITACRDCNLGKGVENAK